MSALREAAQQALDALELGYATAKAEADRYHTAMAGFRPERHARMDAEVQQIAAAITALRAALAQEQTEPQRTPAWWRDGLTATLMREGVNKHRAREIADGYWQAYCEVGGNDE